jgi:hypothetical protein
MQVKYSWQLTEKLEKKLKQIIGKDKFLELVKFAVKKSYDEEQYINFLKNILSSHGIELTYTFKQI